MAFNVRDLLAKGKELIDQDKNKPGVQIGGNTLANPFNNIARQQQRQQFQVNRQQYNQNTGRPWQLSPLISGSPITNQQISTAPKFMQRPLRFQANAANVLQSGSRDINQGITELQQPGQRFGGGLRTVRGIGRIGATFTTPFNVANAFSVSPQIGGDADLTRRGSVGFLEGMTGTRPLTSGDIKNKRYSVSIMGNKVGSFDPVETVGSMMGYVSNPVNKKVFKFTEKILPSKGNWKKWLSVTGTRGALENLLLNTPDMPKDISPEQKARWVMSNLGSGAVQEIVGRGIFGIAGKGVNKLSKTELNKVMTKYASEIYDDLATWWRRANIPVKGEIDELTGERVVNAAWKIGTPFEKKPRKIEEWKSTVDTEQPKIAQGGLGDIISKAKNLSVDEYLKKRIPEITKIDDSYIYTKDGNRIELSMNRAGDGLRINALMADKKGTGIGSKIVEALQEWTTSRYGTIRINKAYNSKFWDKMGFTGVDEYNKSWGAGDKIYRPPLSPSKGGATTKAEMPKRGEITKTQKQIDDLIGYSPTGLNYKQEYTIRQKYLENAKESAPKDVVKEIEKLEDKLDQLRIQRSDVIDQKNANSSLNRAKIEKESKKIENEIAKIMKKPKVRDWFSKLDDNYKVTKDWQNKVRSVQAEPSKKTLGSLQKRDTKLEARNARKEYNEWSKQVFRQEGKRTTTGAINELTRAVKSQTKSPLSDPEGIKDISGFRAYTRDLYRNFEEAYGKNFNKAKEQLLDPFDKSKGRFIRTLKSWENKLDENVVNKYGIKKGSKESADIQRYGEGQITENQLVSKYGKDKASKIIEADKWFRKQYDDLLEQVNATRKKIYPNNPDKIIPKRKDYYRHFREMSEGVRGLLNIFDSPANIKSTLAGTSEYTKPKSKWLSFAQRRLGGETDVDAIGGFIDYVKAAEYAKNIDPHISKFRSLADELAETTEDSGKANNFIQYLHDFANDLSGKTNPGDRFIQKLVGRKTMSAVNWVNNRVKANVILGNVSSSIAQIFNVPQGIASAGRYSVPGLGSTISNIFGEKTPIAKSDFIQERYGQDVFSKFEKGMIQNTKKFAAWMTQALDEVGTKYIWNSHYEKALAEGIQNPIKYADDVTRSLVAGRGIGEVPLLQKSKVFQLVAPFQLEVANLWHVLGRFTSQKQFGKLATFAVSMWIMNRGAEKIRGSDVGFDPIQGAIEAYEAYKNEEDKRIGALKAIGRVSGEVLSNVPGGQTLASLYPEYGMTIGDTKYPTRKDLFGDNDPTRYGSGLLVAKGAQDPLYKLLPSFGGQQIKRTIEGMGSVNKGYAESKSGRIQYPIEQSLRNYIQGSVFGKYSLPEAREYFDNERTPLGEKQSEYVKGQPDKKSAYNEVIGQREENSRMDKVKDKVRLAEGSDISGSKYVYYKNDEVNTVDIGSIKSMPTQTNLQKVEKEKETYSAVKEIMKSTLTEEQKNQALKELGVSRNDATYYSIASRPVDEKYAFVQDYLGQKNPKTSKELVESLIPLIYEVNGDKVLSSRVIDQLYNDKLISKNDKKYLKSLYTEGRKVLREGGSGSVKSAITDSQLLKAYSQMLEALYGLSSDQKQSKTAETLSDYYKRRRQSFRLR